MQAKHRTASLSRKSKKHCPNQHFSIKQGIIWKKVWKPILRTSDRIFMRSIPDSNKNKKVVLGQIKFNLDYRRFCHKGMINIDFTKLTMTHNLRKIMRKPQMSLWRVFSHIYCNYASIIGHMLFSKNRIIAFIKFCLEMCH